MTMKDEFEEFDDDDELLELVGRYEKMADKKEHSFFDTNELEEIIDYYLSHDNLKRAEQAIEFAIAQHSISPSILLRKAQWLVSNNKSEQALKTLKEVERMEPENIDLYMIRGNVFSNMMLYNEAIAEYKKALRFTDEPEDIYIAIAIELENQMLYAEAIEYLKKVLAINPENELAIYEIAFCYEFMFDYEAAIVFFNEFLNKNPYAKLGWFNLGLMYNVVELYEKAIDAYDFTLAIDETFSSAYFNKANTLANMGRYREAIDSYRQTFLYEDADATTHYYIGECFQKLGNFQSAIEQYNKAIESDQKLADAWFALGSVYEESDHLDLAITAVENAIRIEPENMVYLHAMANLLAKTGRITEASETYEKVHKRDYLDTDFFLDYAEFLFSTDTPASAIEFLIAAADSIPFASPLFYRLAAYNLLTAKLKEGLKWLVEALEMDFEGHKDFLEFAPTLINMPEVVYLIESSKSSPKTRRKKRQ